MTGRPDSFMPLFVGDYLRDTLRLTRDQHGGYLLLLMAYWADAEPLLDDDEQLASIAKATPADWKRLRVILSPFFDVRDGRWFHKRVQEELAKATVKYEARKLAGARGNASPKRGAKRTALRPANGAQTDSLGDISAGPLRGALRSQPHLSSFTQEESVARAAAHDGAAAPPAATGWEQLVPKWAEFREIIGGNQWSMWFQRCKTNGANTTIIAPSSFERDEIGKRFLRQLNDHFGEPVTVKIENGAAYAED